MGSAGALIFGNGRNTPVYTHVCTLGSKIGPKIVSFDKKVSKMAKNAKKTRKSRVF
jgi:hypothetical protein